jgi:hypothetical protein
LLDLLEFECLFSMGAPRLLQASMGIGALAQGEPQAISYLFEIVGDPHPACSRRGATDSLGVGAIGPFGSQTILGGGIGQIQTNRAQAINTNQNAVFNFFGLGDAD